MKRPMVTVFFALSVAAWVAPGCVDSRPKPEPTPAFYMKNVKGYAETAVGGVPETVRGWDLVVVGDVARWRECTGPDEELHCGRVERSRPAPELLGVKQVAELEIESKRVQVLELSLAPRPKYVTPNWKPAR